MNKDATARLVAILTVIWMVITGLFGASYGVILAPVWMAVLGIGFYFLITVALIGLTGDDHPHHRTSTTGPDPDETVRITPPIWAPTDREPPTVPLVYQDDFSPVRQPSP